MKKISLLMLLFFCNPDIETKGFRELDPSVQRALIEKHEAVTQDTTKSFAFNCSDTVCCKRGRRGPRGKRGRRGRTGTSATAGLNELFINAEMMFSGVVESFPIDPVSFEPYGTSDVRMLAWAMPSPLISPLPPIGSNFNIPIDLDVTQPVTIVVHMLVDSSSLITGNMAKISVELDIQPNNGLVGTTPPATGPQFFAISPDFIVTPAIPPVSSNLRQISVSMTVDLTGAAAGDWAFIDVARIPAAANEFSGIIYLSTISVQYHRLLS